MGTSFNPLRRRWPLMEPPEAFTPPFNGGPHPLDDRETFAVTAPEAYSPPVRERPEELIPEGWSGIGLPPRGMDERPEAPDPYEPPPMSAAERDYERLQREAPAPQRAGWLRQLAAGVTGSLFPTAGTDIPGKIAYKNYDELQASDIAIERAAKMAEQERARRGEGLDRFKAGTQRQQSDAYNRQVDIQAGSDPLKPSLDERTGTQFIPVNPLDPTQGWRGTTVPGFKPPAGKRERYDDETRWAELKTKAPRAPEEESEFARLDAIFGKASAEAALATPAEQRALRGEQRTVGDRQREETVRRIVNTYLRAGQNNPQYALDRFERKMRSNSLSPEELENFAAISDELRKRIPKEKEGNDPVDAARKRAAAARNGAPATPPPGVPAAPTPPVANAKPDPAQVRSWVDRIAGSLGTR